jgi:hypothetical protein
MKEILEQRKSSHGPWQEQFALARNLKDTLFPHGESRVPSEMREALEHITIKISRVITGNPFHTDHWRDIAGYATLIADDLEKYEKSVSNREPAEPQNPSTG